MSEIIKPDVNSTKDPATPSHEGLERPEHQSHLDAEAEQSAKRAQNRIHNAEANNPGGQIFSK